MNHITGIHHVEKRTLKNLIVFAVFCFCVLTTIISTVNGSLFRQYDLRYLFIVPGFILLILLCYRRNGISITEYLKSGYKSYYEKVHEGVTAYMLPLILFALFDNIKIYSSQYFGVGPLESTIIFGKKIDLLGSISWYTLVYLSIALVFYLGFKLHEIYSEAKAIRKLNAERAYIFQLIDEFVEVEFNNERGNVRYKSIEVADFLKNYATLNFDENKITLAISKTKFRKDTPDARTPKRWDEKFQEYYENAQELSKERQKQ